MNKRAFGFLVAMAGVVALSGASAAPGPSDAATEEARARLREALQNDPDLPSVAPAGYDLTIVVFSDYQCPYCRKLHPALNGLLRDDKKVRIVYRDWPVFGPASEEAARAAMASRYQGKYAAFNDALMKTSGRINAESIRVAAQAAGVDWQRLQADLVTHKAKIDGALARTDQFARIIGLSGTPGLVIGPYLFPGALSEENLRTVVQEARRRSAS
ncbi:MAG: DsbA family protein [Sphingomonadales bacterium]|nr:DsbA family protein [Sphingomonadales bacterium]